MCKTKKSKNYPNWLHLWIVENVGMSYGLVAHGILVSDPVPIGLWILTALDLALGLGLGILDTFQPVLAQKRSLTMRTIK